MGQYGNQPDFGTRAVMIVPQGVPGDGGGKLNSAALYIGTGGTLVCGVVGGNENSVNNLFTTFENIPDGTFFPVIVDYVFTNDDEALGGITTCSDIVALY